MTATPEELTLLLYGGAVKFMKQTIACMKANNITEANTANQRAQAIFEELMCSLDQEGQPEMSQQLYNLYEYINYSLVDANIKKDPQIIEQMIEFTNELRSTWQEAIKLVRTKK
ncbi:flagellar export chaperone FliS [Desulfuribacillus alkaliarsenatis]|uniref:Flagellar export chaperone FliS n=2 Tax=Desulfuribacillus alkaliarsenatis TaxID=766136 RepID=A0A1E5G3T5_9FIRM|nr:flagellar export chaperone FliS [Desulfuribacillus alkaliarsenatis]